MRACLFVYLHIYLECATRLDINTLRSAGPHERDVKHRHCLGSRFKLPVCSNYYESTLNSVAWNLCLVYKDVQSVFFAYKPVLYLHI